MKKIILLLFALSLVACSISDPDDMANNKATIEWINSHEKPIIVVKTKLNGITNEYQATLYDNTGVMFDTKTITVPLPDTIISKKTSALNHYTY